jgi:dihydroorotate dehydrogenase
MVTAAGPGGLSGPFLGERALAVLRRLRARGGDRLVLIAAGGVTTVDDAWQRLAAGATLLQGYTAFIYQGPGWAARIHRGLAARLAAEGKTLAQLQGAAAGNRSL